MCLIRLLLYMCARVHGCIARRFKSLEMSMNRRRSLLCRSVPPLFLSLNSTHVSHDDPHRGPSLQRPLLRS
jgi:hypothetical protein